MREINGKKFFTIYEISNLLKKEFSPDDIKLRIENEELPGLKIDNEWHINKETVDFLVDVMINKKIDLCIYQNPNIRRYLKKYTES